MLVTGDMGIGNTTPSAAVIGALTGRSAAEVVGRGTGIDDQTLARKTEVVCSAIERAFGWLDPMPIMASAMDAVVSPTTAGVPRTSAPMLTLHSSSPVVAASPTRSPPVVPTATTSPTVTGDAHSSDARSVSHAAARTSMAG